MPNVIANPDSLASLKVPLKDDLEQFKEAMTNLQGNILKGHGRKYAAHILLRFEKGRESDVKRWLSDFADTEITSAQLQREHKRPTDSSNPGEPFATLSLSAEGYQYLGFPTSPPFDGAFVFGMKRRRIFLNDTESVCWEPQYREEIHAMALLADDSRKRIDERIKQLKTNLVNQVLHVESGEAILDKNNPKTAFEHFGHVDGVSQPLLFASELSEITKSKWDPSAGPSLVLVPDPLSKEMDAFGSYLVFRKLEQKVGAFSRKRQVLAAEKKISEDRAGANGVGRLPDGTPLVKDGKSVTVPQKSLNDFNYDDDPNGALCPFFAHIRKVNPRGTALGIEAEKTHRIVRRGIPYGEPVKPGEIPSGAEDEGRGLLFMCYQRSIRAQFEVLQGQWSNRDDFPGPGAGVDSIIGQPQLPKDCSNPAFDSQSPFTFANFVTLKGGEYFFTPSIPFLKSLRGQT